MYRIKEAILVEGRYDKAKLSGIFDTLILETRGFSVLNDRERLSFVRAVAAQRGLVILTDSDGAGFMIRRYLKGAIPSGQLYHAYIPDIYGKEKRKRIASKEGKLGVEGMDAAVIVESVRRSGAHFLGESSTGGRGGVTKAEFYALGLSGGENSAGKRRTLARALSLPERLSANELFLALNALYDRQTLFSVLDSVRGETNP